MPDGFVDETYQILNVVHRYINGVALNSFPVTMDNVMPVFYSLLQLREQITWEMRVQDRLINPRRFVQIVETHHIDAFHNFLIQIIEALEDVADKNLYFEGIV